MFSMLVFRRYFRSCRTTNNADPPDCVSKTATTLDGKREIDKCASRTGAGERTGTNRKRRVVCARGRIVIVISATFLIFLFLLCVFCFVSKNERARGPLVTVQQMIYISLSNINAGRAIASSVMVRSSAGYGCIIRTEAISRRFQRAP